MFNIDFLKEYLNKNIFSKVTINMSGILKFTLNILKFKFEINGNKLILKEEKIEVLEINFDEVCKVVFIDNKIYIFFNINEKIIIDFHINKDRI